MFKFHVALLFLQSSATHVLHAQVRQLTVFVLAFNQYHMYHCSCIFNTSSSGHVLYFQFLVGLLSLGQAGQPGNAPLPTRHLQSRQLLFWHLRLWRLQDQLPLRLDLGHRVSVFPRQDLQEHQQVNWPLLERQRSRSRRRHRRRHHRRDRSPWRSIPRSHGTSKPEGMEVPPPRSRSLSTPVSNQPKANPLVPPGDLTPRATIP